MLQKQDIERADLAPCKFCIEETNFIADEAFLKVVILTNNKKVLLVLLFIKHKKCETKRTDWPNAVWN